MTFRSKPTKDGTYRIKIYGQDLYLESIPTSETSASTSGVRLAAPYAASKKQKVCLCCFFFYYISSFDSDLISIPVDPQVVRHLIDYQERRRRRWVKVQENIGDIWRSWLSLPRRIFSSMGHPRNTRACTQSNLPTEPFNFDRVLLSLKLTSVL